MPDLTFSGLPAVTTLADADIIPIINSAASRKVTLSQLTAYFEQRARQNNAAVAAQGPGFSTDTYVTNSDVLIPAGRLQPKSMYRCRLVITKTAAGTVAPVVNVRIGTAGSTGDTSRGTLTFPAQTAIVDTAVIEILGTFRTVGSGSTATFIAGGTLANNLAATGFSVVGTGAASAAVSGGFDSTVANLRIGVSVNGGTSAAWTIHQVQAELFNLA